MLELTDDPRIGDVKTFDTGMRDGVAPPKTPAAEATGV